MASAEGSHGGLYFIVGAIFVVVAILAFLYFGGYLGDRGGGTRNIDIKIEAPKAPSPTR